MKNQILKILKSSRFTKTKQMPFFLNEDPAYSNYEIGRFTYGKPKVYSWDQKTKLSIGSFCSIADNVSILLGGEHRTDWVTTYPFTVMFEQAKHILGHPATKGDIVIGNDIWIGNGALILSGVTISNGSVIAAESVVTKSVEPYTIVGGNPARTLRRRFSLAQIEALLKIAWWNWPIEAIIEALPLLLSDNIADFIAHYSE